MLRRKRYYVIYPEYFDLSLTRSRGRRITKAFASSDPTLKKLEFACKKLEYEFEIQADKAYPSNWWERKGRILISIDKNDKVPKNQVIKEMADIIRRLVPKTRTVEKGKKGKRKKS